MPDQTTNLELPYIAAAQAQKHVTHNEAIRRLDAMVQLAVASRTLSAPPANPSEGVRYIVPASATGAWSGATSKIAAFQDGAWSLLTPREGWLAWVAAEAKLYVYTASTWAPYASGLSSVNPVALVGVNATADATNKLAVAAPATLLSHEGSGHQLKINKAAAANTASLLYQTNFSGRAEYGLTGDDNFHVKVSADGTIWKEAMVVDRTSGVVGVPRGVESLQLVMALDTIATITTPSAAGILAISHVHNQFPNATVAGMVSYDTGTSPAVISLGVGTNLTLSATNPTGTTGAAGRATLSPTASGTLILENRVVANAQFCLTFINGFRTL